MKQEIFNQYAEKVAEAFSVSEGDMFTKNKKQDLADARHTLYYLCSKRPMTKASIQKYMSERGYEIKNSSIIHGIKKIEDKMSTDRDYVNVIRSIKQCVTL
jgi:chromosomal replication initiation ATPase DnaA